MSTPAPPVRAGHDGLTYAKQIDGGEGYVTLIEVVPVDGGWAVERWKASGC